MALRDDQLKWNRRYREAEGRHERPEPHWLAQRWRHLWAGGAMLDAACGLGRGIAGAQGQFDPIYAVDLSEVAIRRARELWQDTPNLHWVVGDVAALAWPREVFGLICAFGFTDLRFFSRAPEMLRSGGMFLSEGFSSRQLEVKPHLNSDWIVQPEKMRSIFSGGRVLECTETGGPPYRVAFAAVMP